MSEDFYDLGDYDAPADDEPETPTIEQGVRLSRRVSVADAARCWSFTYNGPGSVLVTPDAGHSTVLNAGDSYEIAYTYTVTQT